MHGDSGILENFYRAYAGRISEFGADINIFMMARPRYKSLNGNKSNGSHARKSRYSIANINRIAEVIQNLKNYYNSEKVILVGYSGGATTTGIIIGKHPELIDSAILISCPCNVYQWNKSWKQSSSPHLCVKK